MSNWKFLGSDKNNDYFFDPIKKVINRVYFIDSTLVKEKQDYQSYTLARAMKIPEIKEIILVALLSSL